MKKISIIALAISLSACGGGSGTDGITGSAGMGQTRLLQTVTTTPPAAIPSSEFLAAAYQDGLAEVRLSQLAETRAESEDVKEFARAMIEHHTLLNNEIQQLAQRKNITLPTDVSTEQAAEVTRQSSLTGAEFDRNYLRQNVAVHGTDVADALRQAREGSDVDARSLAALALPVLKTHLAVAEDILNKIDPASFLVSAYQSSLAEIEWAQLALERATDEDVSRFAQQIVEDHTEANETIAALAAQKEVTLPSELSPEQQAIAEDLARFSDADFDRAYMDVNVVAHFKAVRYARTQRGNDGRDVDVRALARSIEPILAGHLLMASELTQVIEPSFLYSAFQSNLAEIRLAYLANFRATNPEVKTFAQRMLSEHTAVLTQLQQLAQEQNVALPYEMGPEPMLAFGALLVLRRSDFDERFLQYNERLHEQAIERFTAETQQPTGTGTQNFAQSLLPALNAHLTEARALMQRLGAQSQ